jgi:hypothetical protein
VHTFNGTYADLAIEPSGQILATAPRPPAVTDFSFLSLEGITFAAPTPKFFGLNVRGSEQQGATATVILRKPRTLALLVQAKRNGRLLDVGVVRLGKHPAGLSYVNWNLQLNGHLLPAGRYEVSLHALNGNLLSQAAPPRSRILLVLANGHVRVQK